MKILFLNTGGERFAAASGRRRGRRRETRHHLPDRQKQRPSAQEEQAAAQPQGQAQAQVRKSQDQAQGSGPGSQEGDQEIRRRTLGHQRQSQKGSEDYVIAFYIFFLKLQDMSNNIHVCLNVNCNQFFCVNYFNRRYPRPLGRDCFLNGGDCLLFHLNLPCCVPFKMLAALLETYFVFSISKRFARFGLSPLNGG